MTGLNLPPADLKLKKYGEKNYVFDCLRKQYVRLTPEEYVRQHFIHFLITHRHFPASRLANEVSIDLGNIKKRCDTVLYDDFLQALMIVEYKSPSVQVKQETFDQIARYNMSLNVPWLIVSNGIRHFCCKINKERDGYVFLKDIPDYEEVKA
ncbi:MAG: type I restriction enzyme HsdR N-terminal domain-containing protein [Dysgonamonadaceae bacterium]|jgi:predicted type IV restriction endonuclease|nr:type I restriction enzyme HsdR N-terminal domain-containing protein [Dysgonamonadaceae bacterium]